ncbi:MlaA family lipoprotein [Aliidiomarina celeris]|uniref:MlaA family lipoprotein n=1 Tax=Aliidiomarina celeris TaxID=2249428 RepID=UPI000DE9B4BA|nr:VacJ family lipoprotein [Aliidiomarina celeris]
MKTLGWMFTLLLLVACASAPEQGAEATTQSAEPESESMQAAAEEAAEPDFDFSDPRDPFENFNRVMWDFNRDTLDPYVLMPVANTYEKVPSRIRTGLYNMTDNLKEPPSFVNNLLQLKMADAFTTLGRFTLNTTVGVFGFFDVATKLGLEENHESFGETLAVYGVTEGPYFMLPGVGPTVVIDRGGDLVDDYVWPAQLIGWQWSAVQLAIRGLSQRLELKQLEPMLENSLDEYAFVREAYFSYWNDKVYDGNPPVSDNMWEDDWDSEWESEWDSEWESEGNSTEPALSYNAREWRLIARQAQREYHAAR